MELREHQVEALTAIEAAAAAGHPRMTVVAACGTGKTLIAQRAARRLAPQGTVLVLMPTKALVAQTIRRWRQAGQPGAMFGVCSLSQNDSGLHPREATMTRDMGQIARAARMGQPVTVFCTYGSLHHIQDAHGFHGLPRWDLVIADEAHRTCSAFGDGWGTVHDDAAIPAKTRLYMTATPRIWGSEAAPVRHPFMERIPLATMDRYEIFGPTVYCLGMAEAIGRGLLADYQVVMPFVDDGDLHGILAVHRPFTTAHHNGLRNAALQVALLRAIAEHRLRRVLVFHNRVSTAQSFADTLARTALEVDAPLRVDNLWSQAIHGEQPSDWRRDLLDDFATPDRECAVLSNVRVLNEGVDMPDVDGVAFVDPRYSVIDAIQAIGRGLRQPPGAGKKTTLVIPVYLSSGLSTDDMLKGSAFANLITILQALRAHDETFMDRIALPDSSRRSRTTGIPLHYAHPERAAQLSRALGLEIALPAIGSWEQAHASASTYRTVFGHLDVPADYTDPDGFALGECIASLRLRHILGRLPADHQQALNELGMLWTARVQTFDSMLEHARAWHRAHGHLAVPASSKMGGHPLGRWLATQRTKDRGGRLLPAQHKALADIDPHWNPSWPQEWQRRYARAKTLLPGHGRLWKTGTPLHLRITAEEGDTAVWIEKQQKSFFGLHERQMALLLGIGIPPLPEALGRQRPDSPAHGTFHYALVHAVAFALREGHLDVPRNHYEPPVLAALTRALAKPFALGTWIHKCRTSFRSLTPEQRLALEGLRMVWDPALGRRTAPPGGPAQ